jgi:hypothetical protein
MKGLKDLREVEEIAPDVVAQFIVDKLSDEALTINDKVVVSKEVMQLGGLARALWSVDQLVGILIFANADTSKVNYWMDVLYELKKK